MAASSAASMRPTSVPTNCGLVSRTTPDVTYSVSPADDADSMILKLYRTEPPHAGSAGADYNYRARALDGGEPSAPREPRERGEPVNPIRVGCTFSGRAFDAATRRS